MNVLVLGGCGFIGSHVVDALLEAGHKVRVVDRMPERFRPPMDSVEYCFFNYTSSSELKKALQGFNIVIHCISTTVPANSNRDPQADVSENLLGTLNLLDTMVKCNVSRIIYLSSGGTVYGVTESLPIGEEHALHPLCSYGVVKVAVENYLLMYQHLYGLEPVILRPSNAYGPRQYASGVQGVIPAFTNTILRRRPLDVWGDGSVVRDFLSVHDLASLCKLAVESKVTGIFNVGSGQGHSIHTIIDVLSGILKVSPEIRYSSTRPYDIPEIVLDVRKAASVFGWGPTVSLEEGISEYVSWSGKVVV